MVSRDNEVTSSQQSDTGEHEPAAKAATHATPEQQFEALERRFLAMTQLEEVLEERQLSDRRVADQPVAHERRKRQRRGR